MAFQVSVGQEVNLSARSIVNSKGFYLTPGALDLQAVAVSLNPSSIPFTAPRATRYVLLK